MTGVRVAVGTIVLLLVGGCAAVGGQPAPAEPNDVPSATSAPDPAVPARPRDVPIDGVNPCTLLTEEQRAELGLGERPLFDSSPSLLYPGDVQMCVHSGFDPRDVAVGVSLVTTAGIEFFTAGELDADVRAIEVAGFPAAVAVPTRFTEYCTVLVDVAPGQLVDIQFRDGGGRPSIPQEQLCRDGEVVASAVMDTLLARR